MSKDQGYGFAIFIVSLIVAIVYLVAFFAPLAGMLPSYWHDWAVGIPVLLFVLLVLVISGWIGWTMLTTPPPAPLEPEPTTTPEPEPEPESKSAPARKTSSRAKRSKK
jgi:protein-S-isoprenylcysteine O-methyltransferase Ste14